MTSGDLPEAGPGLAALPEALPDSVWVNSLLFRFGGATGAGAGSVTAGFDGALAAGIKKGECLIYVFKKLH